MPRNRHQSGSRALSLGTAWEDIIEQHLTAWRSQGRVLDFTRYGIQAKMTRSGLVATGTIGVPDFEALTPAASFRFEAKHSSAERWKLSEVQPAQAARLTRWHRPEARCVAGVALRYVVPARGLQRTLWLDWGWLGPRWAAWSAGAAEKGWATLGVEQAEASGVPWSVDVFETGRST